MAPRAADYLEIIVGVSGNPAHDRRHFLASLRLDALDKVRAAFLVEQGVIAVMAGPHAASDRVDEFMGAIDDCTGRKVGQPVRAPGEHVGGNA